MKTWLDSITLARVNILLLITISGLVYVWYQPSEEQLRQERISKLHQNAFDYLDPMSSPDLVRYIHHQLDINSAEVGNFMLHPMFDEYRQVSSNNDEMMDAYRRRLQLGPSPTPPPTDPPVAPFRDEADSDILVQTSDSSLPYVVVDFGDHISYESGNRWCRERLGTRLASVWKNETDRLSQEEQILAMDAQCALVTSGVDIDCWIGLRWDNSTNRFQWENGQRLAPDSGDLIPPDTIVSETNFGADGGDANELGDGATPTAFSIGFQV